MDVLNRASEATAKDEVFAGGGKMGAAMRALDWDSSPLGPVEKWPQSLRTSVSTCLNSRFAIVMWWGPEMVMLYNDAYIPIIGTKHPTALGCPGRQVWPEIWEVVGPMLHGVLERGEATFGDDLLLLLHRNGYQEECYFTFSYSPIRDESGGIGGIFTPVFETTDRVIGERRLRTSRDLADARAASSFSSVHDACQTAVRILAQNSQDLSFAAIYLFDNSENLATLVASTGAEPGVTLFPHRLSQSESGPSWIPLASIARGETCEIDLQSSPLDGLPTSPWGIPPVEAIAVPMLQKGREFPTGFLLSGVNPRKRLSDEFRSFYRIVADQIGNTIREVEAFEQERQRNQALAELDRAKTAFFTNISHEFRTPITLMLAPLEDALARAQIHSEDRDRLKMVHRNGLRLLKLVNALLDFSRIEAGRVTAKYEATALDQFTRDLSSTFRSATERAELELFVECDPIGESAYVDREMWEKIVLNLLSNAFKFTLAGRITVRLRREGTIAKLEVSDTGVGMPEADLPRVFERFYRAEASGGRSIEGTGIGLALVQELVKLHGGSIAVKSELGKGSTFTVSIPIAGPVHLEKRPSASRDLSLSILAEGYVEEALRWLPGEIDLPAADLFPTEERDSAMLRARILVADDNADMREYLSRVLSKEYSVETFANGSSALAALSANPPDLVLADVMMPEISGFELLKRIRENPQTKHLSVILVSARAGQEARIDGLQAGADDYVTKPFSGRELLARVRAQLNLAGLRNEASKREHALRGAAEAERNKLHDLFQLAPAAIVAMRGPELRVVLANERYVKLVGRNSADELLGKTIREALPEVEGQGYFELLDNVYHGGVPFSAKEAEVKLGSNLGALAQQFVDFSYQPTFDTEGNVDGILAHIVDVTEQVKARRKVEESESRFRLIADAAPALIWMAGPDQRTNYFNRSWLDFVGRTLEEEIGDGWFDNVFPEDKSRFSEVYRSNFELREPFEAEFRLRHKSGEHRWILNRAVPRFGPDGTFDGFIGVCIDVNSQKLAEETLRKSEKLAVAGRLAATISHEINNPLQAVTSLLHLMSGSAMSDELRSYLTTAEEELARVTHIVTHGLKFHRQATGARDEKLSELLDSTVAVYQGRVRNSDIKLIREFKEQQPVYCLGSEIRQVFANLIGNAIDASRKGGRIILRTRDCRIGASGTNAVRVTVADTGHGMDSQALTRIFEPFFTTKGTAGTGLGLWVSKGILDKHGAKIRVKSRQEGTVSGTVFSISFPIRSGIDLLK